MQRQTYRLIIAAVCIAFFASASAQPMLPEHSTGLWQDTRSDDYDYLLDTFFAQEHVTQMIDDRLWVPWFSSSSACMIDNLQSGNACDIGEVSFERNCMVTDEFSQVGLLVSMGRDEGRMSAYTNTVEAIPSAYGTLPAWRVVRDGDTIEPCRSGVNGNCDSASDADARVIMSLFNAAANEHFDNQERYHNLAVQMSEDFVEYNILTDCKASSLGYGDICHWLAGGPGARSGGMGSYAFSFTGYYPDAIIAMLQACAQTGDNDYCLIASNITLGYLQAANYDGESFSVPPGMAFRWTNLDGIPQAECTTNCNPVSWEDADAPRALGLCQATHYASLLDWNLPLLDGYCALWYEEHLSDPSRAAIQYYPDGSASAPELSSYFAQGLQSLMLAGVNEEKYRVALDNALSHYSPSTGTWDWTACFGIYHQAFPMRSLGFGVGRDRAVFTSDAEQIILSKNPSSSSVSILNDESALFSVSASETADYLWRIDDTPFSTDDEFVAEGLGEGSYEITVEVTVNGESETATWNLEVEEVLLPIVLAYIEPEETVSITEGDASTLSIGIDNPSGLEVTYAWTTNASENYDQMGSEIYALSGLSVGSYRIEVRALSEVNSVDHTFNVVVAAAENPRPQRRSSGSRTTTRRQPALVEEPEEVEPEEPTPERARGEPRTTRSAEEVVSSYYRERTMEPSTLVRRLRPLLVE